MHYFEAFISLLTDEELCRLESVPKTEAERLLVSYALATRRIKLGEKKVALPRLTLSPATQRKTRSVLLKRAYTAVVPDGTLQLLYLLCDRHALELALHELQRFERNEMTELPPAEQAAVYAGLFRKIVLFPHTHDVLPIVRRLGMKRLKIQPGAGVIERLELECEILRKEIRMIFAKSRPPLEVFEKKLQKLERMLSKIAEAEYIRGRYNYHLTTTLVYHNYPSHCERALVEARLTFDAARKLPEDTRKECIQRSRLFLGSTLSAAGEYEESYNTYRAMLADGPISLHLVGDHYAYFVGDAMLLGKEREIEKELLEHLSEAEAKSKRAMANFYSGLLLPVYLSAGDYPNAKLHIDRHYAASTAKIQANEILFRIFEIAYYYLIGDAVTCSQLLEKNFPLFYRECEREGDSRLLYLKLVRARLRECEEGVSIPKRLRVMKSVFSKVGPYTELSRILLERMGVVFEVPSESTSTKKPAMN